MNNYIPLNYAMRNSYNLVHSLFSYKSMNNNIQPFDFGQDNTSKTSFGGLLSGTSSTIGGFLTGTKNVLGSYTSLNKEAAALASTKPGSLFDKRSADISNSKVVSATVNDKTQIGSFYSLKVNQLATSQQNTGNWLDAKSTWLAPGTPNGTKVDYKVQLQTNSSGTIKNTTVAFSANGGDTNKQALEKAASALNATGLVSAKVESKTVDGVEQVRLAVSSSKTGTDSAFTITDTQGGFTAQADIGTVTTNAQDAKYDVNGVFYTSQSNQIKIDKGQVSLDLKGTTKPGETVNIKVTPGVADMVDQVSKFVGEYNNTVKSLADNAGFVNSQVLDITKFTAQDKFRLGDRGITVNSDGTLKIDEKKLEAALKTDFAATRGTLTSLAKTVQNKTSAVINTPVAAYANQSFLRQYSTGSFFDISA